MSPELGIILQARMGSSRLPGKVLKPIGAHVLLEHCVRRVALLAHHARLVVATSVLDQDDVIERFCRERSIDCFRGSESDVLSRYYLCALERGFQHIVRLTADNPFTDIEELDRLIELHLHSKADYSHSFGVLPVGVGAEIFTFGALERSYREGRKENHKEHVNEYIQENPGLLSIAVLDVPAVKRHPDIRLTVDTEEDLARVRAIAENCSDRFITTEEAVKRCSPCA